MYACVHWSQMYMEVKRLSYTNGHETEGKKVDPEHSKCICSNVCNVCKMALMVKKKKAEKVKPKIRW